MDGSLFLGNKFNSTKRDRLRRILLDCFRTPCVIPSLRTFIGLIILYFILMLKTLLSVLDDLERPYWVKGDNGYNTLCTRLLVFANFICEQRFHLSNVYNRYTATRIICNCIVLFTAIYHCFCRKR